MSRLDSEGMAFHTPPMSVLFRTFSDTRGVFDELESCAGDLQIRLARTGAEMISLRARSGGGDWVGLLHRDGQAEPPAEGWANHATVMGYYLHRLWQEHSVYRGQTIRGGNHGFLRHFQFAAPEVEEDGICYRVPADQVPPEAYPLRVSLELRYRLRVETGVEVEFLFRNEEPELEAHVSFGLHPGFAVTSLGRQSLLMPPGTYHRHLAPGNFLDGRVESFNHPGGPMPFAVEDLPGSFILGIEEVPQRSFVLPACTPPWDLHLDFSECPYLTLWTDGPDFLCVEPCWGLPDSNPPTPFEEKPGIQKISPGAELKKTFRIRPVRAQ